MKINKFDEQLRQKKAMNILNSKLKIVLPDLMSSNTKLGQRLRNKLKASTLFNSIENKNRKYLKGFIFSSNQRADFLKTGLDLERALKQSRKNINSLCDEMESDIILRNMNVILNEKKVLNENTEQETHLKINNLINAMKKAIKPVILYKKEEDKKDVKILTENEIEKAKEYVGNKIIKEQNHILNDINNYVNKFNSTFMNNSFEDAKNKVKIKRDFNHFIETLNFQKDIKLINYKKPKPIPIRDKETTNLVRIKKLLYPSNSKIKEFKDSLHKIKRNASMNNIYDDVTSPYAGKTADNLSILDKIKNIDVSGQDTMQILDQLAKQKNYLSERMEQKLQRVNSLIEIKLPYLNNYELILNYIKEKNKSDLESKKKKENNSNERMVFSPLLDENDDKIKLKPSIKQKLLALKNDIQIIDHKSELFYKHFFENEKMTIYNKLKGSLNQEYRRNINRSDADSLHFINKDKKGENLFITEKK